MSGLAVIIKAFEGDSFEGFLCLVIPLYQLHWISKNWEEVKHWFALQIAGLSAAVMPALIIILLRPFLFQD